MNHTILGSTFCVVTLGNHQSGLHEWFVDPPSAFKIPEERGSRSVTPNFLNDDCVHITMAKGRAAEVRVRAKETVKLGSLDVTNRTANSIIVKKTAGGLVVTNCCLEEQGM